MTFSTNGINPGLTLYIASSMDSVKSKGFILQSEAGRFKLRVAGYADDTVVFVKDPDDISYLLRDL